MAFLVSGSISHAGIGREVAFLSVSYYALYTKLIFLALCPSSRNAKWINPWITVPQKPFGWRPIPFSTRCFYWMATLLTEAVFWLCLMLGWSPEIDIPGIICPSSPLVILNHQLSYQTNSLPGTFSRLTDFSLIVTPATWISEAAQYPKRVWIPPQLGP